MFTTTIVSPQELERRFDAIHAEARRRANARIAYLRFDDEGFIDEFTPAEPIACMTCTDVGLSPIECATTSHR